MIDQYMTKMQIAVAFKSAFYFNNKNSKGSMKAFGAYGVMPIIIGLIDALDYMKLPLAAIEEIAKGIFLLPAIPFSKRLTKRIYKHFEESINYGINCVYKLLHGTPTDLSCVYHAISNPFKAPHSLFTFYGVNYVDDKAQCIASIEREHLYPSICKVTR